MKRKSLIITWLSYMLLSEKGMKYADNLQHSILKIADAQKTKDEILARESY
ncbi:hypothetical protein VAZ01S_017_01030 [Vibrio azureus NBRC 104587]|uniref:Uncharacterized protein n=1 Tax=Vibrio azureus NBRC 104587 TaxID=1219077 RepID=U3C9A4_9VIBR|nr:hypothetical protein VAZ01S_017_01030 [Vibrio azureus NBRC 104587]